MSCPRLIPQQVFVLKITILVFSHYMKSLLFMNTGIWPLFWRWEEMQAFCCKISLCHVLGLVMINTYKPLLLVVEKLWIYWLSNYMAKANNIRPDNGFFFACLIVTVVDIMTYLCFMVWISKIFLILLEKIGTCLNSKMAWEWGYD